MILVDGHNLAHKLKGEDIVKNVEYIETKLQNYSHRQKRQILLVFDGNGGYGDYGDERRLSTQLKRVFPGKKKSADDWIADYTHRQKGESIDLVTADIRLYERVKRKGLRRLEPLSWWNSLFKKDLKPKEKEEFGDTKMWMEFFGEDA